MSGIRLRRLIGSVWIATRRIVVVACFGLLPQWLTAQTVNHVPELMPLTNWVVGERRLVTFTNVASDVDVPPQTLLFSVGPGAPQGVNIDPVTGVFLWRPSEIQGGTTNRLEIVVSDNGVPSLSATQQFQIIVRDTLPDFALSIGSTNLLLNETGSVSVMFSTLVPVTNISFTLGIDTERLRDVAFTPRIANGAMVQFSAIGSNSFGGSIASAPGSPLQGTLELGALSFAVVDQTNSAIVSLDITDLSGIRSDGREVGRTTANPGRAFVVIAEPLLEIRDMWQIRIYLLPGHTASVLRVDPTRNPWRWEKHTDIAASLSKRVRVIDPLFQPSWLFRVTDPRRP